MKAVFDTNILISVFLVPGGQAERAFILAQRKKVALFTSIPILTEFARKLREKFGVGEREVTAALRLISRVGTVVKPRQTIHLLRDDPDNRILECALQSRADVIVTGDTHLLKLRNFQGIAILRLREFLRSFPAESTDI
ncbi:MAG: putative toxin-antitoxin system toxin component, PIN family [Candidatus Binatia bacterium]